MIATLTGQVTHQDQNTLILEVGGIGYQISVPKHVPASVGLNLRLYCSHQVRETSNELYGFPNLTEKVLFELLLSVPGIGPKGALSILGIGSVERIETAIINGDTTVFEAVSGIGKKVAAKIIVELKTKIGGVGDLLPNEHGIDAELVNVLEGLGYRKAEFQRFLGNLPADLPDTQGRLRWVLQKLSRR